MSVPRDHVPDDYARYQSATRWLESFIREPGLERVRHLLRQIGDPQDQYPTVHVGGTSGKGSTTTLVGEILRQGGYRVGIHTTPYLQSQLEKLLVDGRYIAPAAFADLIDELRPHARALALDSPYGPPNYGELSVAIAYLAFARTHVDWAIVEVGMGGRLDFTNVITPRVSVITTVSYDHVKSLGPTLAEIAYHKAGIIKPAVPVVTGVTAGEAFEVIAHEANRLGAPLFQLARDVRYRVVSSSLDGTVFDCETPWGRYDNLRVALLGEHQAFNAALAVGAVGALRHSGTMIDEAAVRAGLATARFPGRLELVQRDPVVVLDGAHNPEKAAALVSALATLFSDKRLVLVLGVLESKDAHAMIDTLVSRARVTIATEASVTGKVAVSADFLARQIEKTGAPVTAVADPAVAVEEALRLATPDEVVVVTGSLYLVGRVRERWAPEPTVVATGSSYVVPEPAGS